LLNSIIGTLFSFIFITRKFWEYSIVGRVGQRKKNAKTEQFESSEKADLLTCTSEVSALILGRGVDVFCAVIIPPPPPDILRDNTAS
jgi:hypothetical protein